jgi:hypothetical protein
VAKTLLIVGFELASDDAHEEDFTSRTSLLDWDIVLFRPTIDEFISYGEEYKGRPSLNDGRSFQLKESCEHWRREIKQAVDAGKTIIVFLPAVQEVYIDTGDRQYSGTGRNQKTTRLVAPYDNYHCIPADLGATTATGNAIKLSQKGAEVLAPYWSEFGEVSLYNVVLTADKIPACLVTKNGDKPVGALFRSKNSNGSLVCLPDIDFYPEHFLKDEGEGTESTWTPEAQQFAARLISAVVSLDSALRSSGEVTPEPSWAANPTYSLASERALRVELLEVEAELEQAQKRKEDVLEKLKSTGRLRALLYEKGKPLEEAVVQARSFQFGTVCGWLDCRIERLGDNERIEFSWEGSNDTDPGCGRGWALIRSGELHGRLYIHAGDDSSFRAQRAGVKSKKHAA